MFRKWITFWSVFLFLIVLVWSISLTHVQQYDSEEQRELIADDERNKFE